MVVWSAPSRSRRRSIFPDRNFPVSFQLTCFFSSFCELFSAFGALARLFSIHYRLFLEKEGLGYPAQYGYEPSACLEKGGKISHTTDHLGLFRLFARRASRRAMVFRIAR